MLVLFLPFSGKQTSCLDIYRDNIFLFPEVLFSDNFLPRLQKNERKKQKIAVSLTFTGGEYS